MYSQYKVIWVKLRSLWDIYNLFATLEVKQVLHKLNVAQQADEGKKKSFEKQNKTCVIAPSETFSFLEYIQTL